MNKFLLVIIVTMILGCASKQYISGTIYISGNEPFTQLSLRTEDDTYYKIECSDDLNKKLWQLQGEMVQLNVVELRKFENHTVAVIDKYITEEQKIQEEQND